MLEPHANLTGTDWLNDSFTFLLRADRVQPAVGCLPFTIVPPDPFLLQTFMPDVSLLVTADNLVTSGLSKEKRVVSSGPTAQTGTLRKLTQTRWQEADPWRQRRGEEPTLDGKASPTRVIWPPDAIKASPGTHTLPRESGYSSLMVIVPLTAVVFLLIVTTVALFVWLLGCKEKAKPLIKPQTSLEPTTPGARPEKSITIPTVTVTPLLKSSSSPVSVFSTWKNL
uniref:Uncharacterized protein n=1 Tax=Catagonus wagneri TaxID=51154 RepID=A0A8C3VG48_9CETA